MKKFMNEDFLLTTSAGKNLYHGYAEKCPVIDFDNYLSAKDLFRRRNYDNLTRLWLETDPDKQAAMRRCGVEEFYITGVAADYDKFLKFAEIIPKLIGAPVYYETHLELQRIFGIHTPLNKETATEIWHRTGALLAKDGYDIVSLLDKMDVRFVCTAAEPADDLEWHLRCAASDKIPFGVLPSFCPDIILNIDQPLWFNGITALSQRYGIVHDWESLKEALKQSLDYFCEAGCKMAEHTSADWMRINGDPEAVVKKMIHDGKVTYEEAAIFKGALMEFLSREYAARNIVNLQDESLGGIGNGVHGLRGISNQIDLLMETGMLSGSVGMLTDSRSFTSFVRHEYYRRILCEKIGLLVESGQYPDDLEFLGEMVQDICWRNAVEYFGFEV